MYFRIIAAAAIGALIGTSAFAADSQQTASANSEWQASKLINMNVYNDQNQKIGDIKELLIDKSGKIDQVAIAVGGFLGMGEHDVAVKFDQLKWSNAPVSSTSASSSTTPATTGANTSSSGSVKNYPDHAVLSATKDQLKAMPQFDYSK